MMKRTLTLAICSILAASAHAVDIQGSASADARVDAQGSESSGRTQTNAGGQVGAGASGHSSASDAGNRLDPVQSRGAEASAAGQAAGQRTRDAARDMAGQARSTVRQTAESAADRGSAARDQTESRVRAFGDRISERGNDVKSSVGGSGSGNVGSSASGGVGLDSRSGIGGSISGGIRSDSGASIGSQIRQPVSGGLL